MDAYLLYSNIKHIYNTKEKRNSSLYLYGAKGERVAFQILIQSPCTNVRVKLNTEFKYEIFYEKYVNLKQPSCELLESGMYPDIMVDELRAIKFGDDSAKYGELLIWCFIDIPISQKNHSEKIKIDIVDNNATSSLFINLHIFDFIMPKQNHNKTSFTVSDEMIQGNTTEVIEKMDELIDLGLHYKLSPARILPWGRYNNDLLIEKMKKYTIDDRCTNFSIPYTTYWEKDVITDKDNECIDINNLYSLLMDMAQYSTNECNLFKKGTFYITFIDEPTPDRFYRVRRVYRAIHDLKRKVVKNYDFSSKREVELALLTMDNICTTFNKEPVYGEVDTWCPTYWAYRKPEYIYEEKALRKLGKKNWWYGCMGPLTPFPNLHTDSPMKDSRYESFLRYKFDIIGNLYWATNINKKYVDDKVGYLDCDLINGENNFQGVNGDGTLFYTETYYGKPLPSLRVFSMFLGLQEYEYFYLFDNYLTNAISFYNKNMQARSMLENIFITMSADSLLPYEFDCENIRKELGSRVELAKNNIFIDCYVKDKKRYVDIYSPHDKEIFLNNNQGEIIPCGKGIYNHFIINNNELFQAIISYKNDGIIYNTEPLVLFEKNIMIDFCSCKALDNKIKCESFTNELNVSIDSFVNEEKPKISIDFNKDISCVRQIKFNIESYIGDAFILNVILVDEDCNRFHAGYCVVEDNKDSHYNIDILPFAENRIINVAEDIEFSKHIDENSQKLKDFKLDKIKGIELMFENNIKLLDENRERRISNYIFSIKDAYFILI